MATKFSTIYKQELKGKGILSSMGSAVLKSARERTDIRNMIFGGKGMFSATGQKAFGRGYSALSSGAGASPSAAQAAAQSSATGDLLASSERQEALLRVVAKNTFNMNMMARDMNITRQNIATLTRLAAGKAAQSQDALWYDVKTRNQSIDSLGKKTPTKTTGNTQSSGSGIFGLLGGLFSGGANFLGAVVSGLLGVVGTVGGGILSTIATVLRFVPGGFLIGTIALAGVAYLLKKVSENVNFSGLTDKILRGLGLDPDDKENSLTKQILKKLGFSDSTAGTIENTFKDIGQTFSNIFEPVVRTMLIHSRAAFNTLTHSFSILGEEFKYQADKLFNENKGKIFAAIAVGLMGPAALLSPKLAIGAAGLAGAFGYLTRDKTVKELQEDLAEETRMRDLELTQLIPGRDLRDRPEEARAYKVREIMAKWERGENLNFKEEAVVKNELKRREIQAQIETLNRAAAASQNRQSQMQNFPQTMQERYQEEVQRETSKYLQSQTDYGGGSNFGTTGKFGTTSSTTPSRISSTLSGIKWKDLSEEQKTALLNAQSVSEGFTIPGTLPNRLNNPGALKWAAWQAKYGGTNSGQSNDGGKSFFTRFPSVEQGRAAQRALWETGKPFRDRPGYADANLLDALKMWVAPGDETSKGFQNYIGRILDDIKAKPGVQISERSSELSGAQRASMFAGAGGETVVNTTNNIAAGGRGDSQSFDGALNFDAIELFVKNA
jgi:hypothetical protein